MACIKLHDKEEGKTDSSEGFSEDSMKIYFSQMLTGNEDENKYLAATCKIDSMIKKYILTELHMKPADKYNLSTVTSQSFSQDIDEDDKPLSKTIERVNEYLGTCQDISVRDISRVLCETQCCTSKMNLKFHVLCLVLETFPIKEVWINARKMWISTGMAIITDASINKPFKLMFWSDQCSHLFSLSPGSVMFASKVVTSSLYKDTVLKLVWDSVLFNFGLAKDLGIKLQTIASSQVNEIYWKIKELCTETVKKFPSLVCKGKIINKNFKVSLIQDFERLTPGIIVHARAKISTMQRTHEGLHKVTLKSTSLFNPASCHLHLHGSAQPWMKKIIMYRQHVWEFCNLACCMSSESVIELHTTVLSTAECLFHEDDRVPCQSPFLIVASSHKELTLMLQNEQPSALLRSVRTDKFMFCNIFDLQYITKTTPVDSIVTMLSSYMKKSWEQNNDYIALMANCFFTNEPGKTFRIKFTSFDKLDELSANITKMLQNNCDIAVSLEESAHTNDMFRILIFFKEFL